MPAAVSILQRLHQHRAWANEKLLEAAAALLPDELRQPFDIGQGNVWQSLLHMYAAEYLWLETILGNRFTTEDTESTENTALPSVHSAFSVVSSSYRCLQPGV